MIRQIDKECTLLQGPILDLERETGEENKEIFNANEWCPSYKIRLDTYKYKTNFNFFYMRVTSEIHYVRMHVSYFGTIYG